MYKEFNPENCLSMIRLQVMIDASRQLMVNANFVKNTAFLSEVTVESLKECIDSMRLISMTHYKLTRQMQDIIDNYESE